jgi:site-specific DNA-methyltransferase (adenine-specific)
MNMLYFGDNLDVLKTHVGDASVDLIYLDPPFNKKSTFNILYTSPVGEDAQRKAFEDTWRWEDGAEEAMEGIRKADLPTFKILCALQDFLGQSDLMAYLAMMAVRLVELRRVLKPNGSLYLHCDPTASHYLKVILDGVFGAENFRNEITWKRTSTHSDSGTWSRVADTILFYTMGRQFTWNIPREMHRDEYLSSKYRSDDGDGRGRYQLDNMTSPTPRPNMTYEWLGYPPPVRGWRYKRETMQRLHEEQRIWYPSYPDGSRDVSRRPRLKRYLDEQSGGVMGSIWTDIRPLNSQAEERIGYPTQKPLALLERIIAASSNPDDMILDPFCGCGTAVHAAERLDRSWIGIDITYLAIQVIEDRIKTWLPHATYQVEGIPKDLFAARQLARMNPHVFQDWSVGRVGGQSRGRGPDKGIDGEISFIRSKGRYGHAIVSVKAGKSPGPDPIRALKGVVQREGADMGVFICVEEPTPDMRTEAATGGRLELPGGSRPRIQIVTASDLIAGPNLGILTELNTVRAAQEAKVVRRKKVKRPTHEELRREPQLPPMSIEGGGKPKDQVSLDLDEPILVNPRSKRASK